MVGLLVFILLVALPAAFVGGLVIECDLDILLEPVIQFFRRLPPPGGGGPPDDMPTAGAVVCGLGRRRPDPGLDGGWSLRAR